MPDDRPSGDPPDAPGPVEPDPRELAAVDDLVAVLRRTVPAWLERCVVRTCERQLGTCPEELRDEARAMAERVAPAVVDEIEALVNTDVDHQRTTPLTVLRDAVRHPTSVLQAVAVPPVTRDSFVAERFPSDRYDLAPAAWADVDPDLHEPGLLWGAAKAAAVLRRRRPERRRGAS